MKIQTRKNPEFPYILPIDIIVENKEDEETLHCFTRSWNNMAMKLINSSGKPCTECEKGIKFGEKLFDHLYGVIAI